MRLRLCSAGFVLAFSVTQAAAEDDELWFRCALSKGGQIDFLMMIEDAQVTHISFDDAQTCEMTVTKNLFEWQCEGTEERWASYGRINRYTGELEREWGEPPFGKHSSNNVYMTGLCQKVDQPRKF